MSDVVLVPGVLALLPQYAGSVDPVADLRAACLAAVATLPGPVEVVADPQGRRVADHLLEATGPRPTRQGGAQPASYLVVGNGSACRTEKAPGHLDLRAADVDAALGKALAAPDLEALAGLDPALSRELWASTDTFGALAEILHPDAVADVSYDDDPFGVQYWVVRWESRGHAGQEFATPPERWTTS